MVDAPADLVATVRDGLTGAMADALAEVIPYGWPVHRIVVPEFDELGAVLARVETENPINVQISLVVDTLLALRTDGRRVFFIGNGASASHASHMAADFLKTGRFRALCFNDPALLTCLGNDLGYERTMSEPLLMHGKPGDILFAISSSGASLNIAAAARSAIMLGMEVATLTGMRPDNPLRKLGKVNFYVPSMRYGIVETAHLAILHTILDRVVALS